ncbi:hypothetical protein ScPMuIL_006978 [Solemya velum]
MALTDWTQIGHSCVYCLNLVILVVLVNRKTVLTAAHCINDIDLPANQYTVVLGLQRRSQLSSEISSGDAKAYDVESITVHPSFASSTKTDDIAVVKLSSKVELRNDIRLIRRLARNSDRFVGNSDCWISGFGWIDSVNGILADNLQVANMDVVSQQACRELRGDTVPGTVCLFNGFNEESGCAGDSGGPLVCRKGKEQVLLGLSSFGPKYCDSYTIYTSIAAHRPWLRSLGVK